MNQTLSPYSIPPVANNNNLVEKLFGIAGLAALAYAVKRKLTAVEPSSTFTNETITTRFVAAIPTITPVLNLEVAVATQTETFTQTSSKKVFWGLLDLGDNTAQVLVPVTYRYHICLRDQWQLSVTGYQVSVICPVLRASLPPAIHTDQMERLSVRGWGRWTLKGQLQQMEAQLTPALSQNAGDGTRFPRMRAVASLDENVRLNKALWHLAESVAASSN